MKNDYENELLMKAGKVQGNLNKSNSSAVNKVGSILFIVVIWIVAFVYIYIFGITGGRFVLSFVFGIPAFLTYFLLKK